MQISSCKARICSVQWVLRADGARNIRIFPPVAKLDIAVDSDSKGRGFESLRAGQSENTSHECVGCFCFVLSEGEQNPR